VLFSEHSVYLRPHTTVIFVHSFTNKMKDIVINILFRGVYTL